MTSSPSPFRRRAVSRGFTFALPRALARALFAAVPLALAPAVQAQSFCASDGQPAVTAVVERFISADCERCWADAGETLPAGALAVDWIVPGARGDDAPLSAAASVDATARLAAIGLPAPGDSATGLARHGLPSVQRPESGKGTNGVKGARGARGARGASAAQGVQATGAARLRVAHGLPVNQYLGASIELKPVAPRTGVDGTPWTAWLLLVESIPAGSDGTPVARHLVRNALVQQWNPADAAPAAETPPGARPVPRLFESRPMGVPEGARPDRLRVIGWVQDAQGRMLSAAASYCAPDNAGNADNDSDKPGKPGKS